MNTKFSKINECSLATAEIVNLVHTILNKNCINPYWQITETKSKNWEITHRVSRKQIPEKF